MSVWDDGKQQIESTKVALDAVLDFVRESIESDQELSPEESEYRDATQHVVTQAQILLSLVDVRTAPGDIRDIGNGARRIAHLMPIKQWVNIWNVSCQALNEIKGMVGELPHPVTTDVLEPFVLDVKDKLHLVTRDAEQATKDLTSIINTTQSEADKLKERLQLIEKRFEEVEAELQESRKQAKEEAAKHRKQTEQEALEHRGRLSARIDTQIDEWSALYQAESEKLGQTHQKYEKDAADHLTKIQSQEAKATELMQLVSGAAIGHGFQHEANSARTAARWWQGFAIFGLIATCATALFHVLFSGLPPGEVGTWVTRAGAVLPFILLFAYAAKQASSMRLLEQQQRQVELSLLALEPYLSHFSDPEKRESLRERLVPRFFEPPVTDESKGDDSSVSDALSTILNIVKAAKK